MPAQYFSQKNTTTAVAFYCNDGVLIYLVDSVTIAVSRLPVSPTGV